MSADNFVGVRPNADGTYSIFEYGNMSVLGEDCMYLSESKGNTFVESREKALVVAHDLVNEMDVCEYGVVEMDPVRNEPCGRCYVCVNVRGVTSDELDRCTKCGKAITDSEWKVHFCNGIYHRRCEPKFGTQEYDRLVNAS